MRHEIHSPWLSRIILASLLIYFPARTVQAQSGGAEQVVAFDIDRAWQEIEQRLRDYENALKKGNLAALGNLYTIDAEILHNGGPSTVGRENIVKIFEKMVRDSATVSGFETTGLWGNDELLVEQGKGFFAHAAAKWTSHGLYLLVWKKVDGEWRIFRDTWFKQKN